MLRPMTAFRYMVVFAEFSSLAGSLLPCAQYKNAAGSAMVWQGKGASTSRPPLPRAFSMPEAQITPQDIRDRASAAAFGNPLVTNAFCGIVVGMIVASALGDESTWTAVDWGGWDFERKGDDLRLEVRQSAAMQSWGLAKSPPSFDIGARTCYWKNGVEKIVLEPPTRLAHVYVFAHHPQTDQTADHRDPGQWRFYVIPTDQLPARQKSISLSGVRQLAKTEVGVNYGELACWLSRAPPRWRGRRASRRWGRSDD